MNSYVGVNGTARKIYLGSSNQGSALNIGTFLKIPIADVYYEWWVVHKGLDPTLYGNGASDDVVCMLLPAYAAMQWGTSTDYAASTLHSYLNHNFLGWLPTEIQAQVKEIKIPYRAGSVITDYLVSKGTDGLPAKVWTASKAEIVPYHAPATSGVWDDGAQFDIYKNEDSSADARSPKILAFMRSPTLATVSTWTRTPTLGSSANQNTQKNAFLFTERTAQSNKPVTTGDIYTRPCMVLPLDVALQLVV